MNELKTNYKSKQQTKDQVYEIIIGAQCLLCVATLLYCILGRYHQQYKGLIALLAQVAVTTLTWFSYIISESTGFSLLIVISIALFVFIHVNTRKWLYLSNDHDQINDYTY